MLPVMTGGVCLSYVVLDQFTCKSLTIVQSCVFRSFTSVSHLVHENSVHLKFF